MTISRIGAGVGTAAVAVGLSIFGPQAPGVAVADTGSANPAATNHAGDGTHSASGAQARSARPNRSPGAPAAGARSRAAAAVTSAGSRRVATPAAPSIPRQSTSPATAATGRTAAAPDTVQVTSTPTADVANAVHWGPAFSPKQANIAVNGWLDSVQRSLSGWGTNPVSDLLQGALLLVRRNLFDQTPTARSYDYAVRSNGQVLGAFNVVDPEGARVTYTVTQAPTKGTATVNADGTWTYTPGADFDYDSFKVTVDDGGHNIFDPSAGSRTVTVRVGDDPNVPVQGIGTISKYIWNDTGIPLINAYYGPRFQGTYNGIVSGPPDNFVLQPGDYAVYETEWNIFSGDAYDVTMQWQAPVSGPRQYLWTVEYIYEGTGTANDMSCSVSSSPCKPGPDAPDAYLLPPTTV